MHVEPASGSAGLSKRLWGGFWFASLITLLLVAAVLDNASVTHAAAVLTIEPVTWNIVGLDGGNIHAGPNIFPVGARICNQGGSPATNVVVDFTWDSSNEYISLLDPGTSSLAYLADSSCVDFYFTIDVARDADAFGTARSYHISASADGLSEISTPLPREIYVERLEARQPASQPQISGPQQVTVGQVYQYAVTSQLAADGIEQVNQYLDFPAGMFQVLAINTDFSLPAGTSADTPYVDACGWDSNPESQHYRSCSGPPRIPGERVGGTVTTSYTVKVLASGSAGISWMVHDFSAQDGFAYLADPGAEPFWITAVPQQETPTETVTITGTVTLTATLPTETATLTQTATLTPTITETPTLTGTPPTETPTSTPTETSTSTPTETSTSTPTETPTTTGTPPTATPTNTPTSTSTATATSTATSTPTITGTPPTATPTGTITPNLTLTKTSNKTSAKVGETFTFTIKITNSGSAAASSVSVVDILNSYLDLVSATTTQGTKTTNFTTRTTTVTVGTVDPGETVTITIDARVNSSVKASTSVTNVVTMTYFFGTTLTKTASVTVTVLPSSTLPGTGFPPLDASPGGPSWVGLAVTLLFALGGAAALGYSLFARRMHWPRRQAALTVGVVMLTAALVTGLAVWKPVAGNGSTAQRPGLSIARVEPGHVVQQPLPDQPGSEAESAQPAVEELETLPDYPVPTPVLTITPRPGEDAPDTSEVMRIVIPSIGVDTVVKYVPFDGLTWLISGLQQEVAWLGDTSWPGLGGNTALAGHVIVRNGAPGPFYKLGSLSPGDEVVIYTQENVYSYRVREQAVVDETDVSVVQPSTQAQLTLVTCTDWDNDRRVYLKRRVVFADLESVEAQAEQRGN